MHTLIYLIASTTEGVAIGSVCSDPTALDSGTRLLAYDWAQG